MARIGLVGWAWVGVIAVTVVLGAWGVLCVAGGANVAYQSWGLVKAIRGHGA